MGQKLPESKATITRVEERDGKQSYDIWSWSSDQTLLWWSSLVIIISSFVCANISARCSCVTIYTFLNGEMRPHAMGSCPHSQICGSDWLTAAIKDRLFTLPLVQCIWKTRSCGSLWWFQHSFVSVLKSLFKVFQVDMKISYSVQNWF